jgi:tRNA threonylcarbamoyladenosine biosynthesis protein TsaB
MMSPATDPDTFLVLGIETSTPAGGVALVNRNGFCMACDWWQDPFPVSRRLMKSIDSIMRHCLEKSQPPAAVSTSHGPGAFTGIRVGLGIAKTLAYSWNIPLYTCSTLQALAAHLNQPDCLVCPVLDARRGEVYHGLYESHDHGIPQPVRPNEVSSIDTLLSHLLRFEQREIWFTGNGSTLYRNLIVEKLGDRARWPPGRRCLPAAESTAAVGLYAHLNGSDPADPMTAAPVYLRPSDAEKRHRITLPKRWCSS